MVLNKRTVKTLLTLPIKKQWFDMIAKGEKKEEYREIKPYYTVRFQNIGLLSKKTVNPTGDMLALILQNGYGKDAPKMMAFVRLLIRKGKPEWGAEPGKTYYVLKILNWFPV